MVLILFSAERNFNKALRYETEDGWRALASFISKLQRVERFKVRFVPSCATGT
jgi:hypothetical protein